jgi:hypothetical protein
VQVVATRSGTPSAAIEDREGNAIARPARPAVERKSFLFMIVICLRHNPYRGLKICAGFKLHKKYMELNCDPAWLTRRNSPGVADPA